MADGEQHDDSAFWCEEHQRRECTRQSKNNPTTTASRPRQVRGGRCHQPAIKGQSACRMHVGIPAEEAKARGQANLMRAAFAVDIPASEYADPGDVLLWSVTVSARQVAWLRGLVADRLNPDGTGIDSDTVATLVKLEQDERLALTRAAKMALDAGIAERQIRMAERVAEQLVAVLRGVVTELGHDPADPEVAGVCRRHLHLIAGAA